MKNLKSILSISLVCSVFAVSTWAEVVSKVELGIPKSGVVVEGIGVPGVDLGDTREEVLTSYGEPTQCTSVASIGDMASCVYRLDIGEQVSIRYRGADGRDAQNSQNDIVQSIRWIGMDEWITSAGVNYNLAHNHSEALLDAYPDPTLLSRSHFTGEISRLIDVAQGFTVSRSYNPYSNRTSTRLSIFPARPVQ
ncbi:hypothetical protein [Agaribacterium sp. ZY112]|uniref:hypothetical protein n=1 Tax=Agaribacterium sp. ZY112 TaxID=3233574 RepID=UPI0035252D44